MLNKLITILLILFTTMAANALNYTVSFDKAKSHYVTVEIAFDAADKDFVDFKVPVWTPGSYKVREFSKAYENVQASGAEVTRQNKNTWRVDTKGKSKLTLSYDVYCFVISPRESYADEYYAFLHSVSAFGYLEGYEKEAITLTIKPYKGWNNVEVALPQNKAMGWVFSCENYDLLADSPIALGNFETTSYTSGKVPHKVVMIGEGNYDLPTIKEDFKKISDSQVEMMGDHPSQKYIHFIYNMASGGGGLEHLNSQTSGMVRWNYTNPSAYRNFLGLIAHEYFHLWNVKRIRPIQLGPFNYNEEVYTDMLWIAEGITSYYDDLTLYRIGKMEQKQYLNILSSQINRLENSPGKDVMSLAHSSLLTWVKAYLPNEESPNKTISYYNKGMVAALLLDLEIRSQSEKCLDDVMTTLYSDYYKKLGRGFTHEEFIKVCSDVAGRDMQSFFDEVVFSTKPLNYTSIFSKYGLDFKNSNAGKTKAWSGVRSKAEGKSAVITNITAGSPAIEAGLSVHDEIISINGWRVSGKLEDYDNKFGVNDGVEITYARDAKIHTTIITYVNSPLVKYELTVADEKNKLFNAWIGK